MIFQISPKLFVARDLPQIQTVKIDYIAQPYNDVTKYWTCLCVNPINVNALECDYRLSTQDHTRAIEAVPRCLPGSGLFVHDNFCIYGLC